MDDKCTYLLAWIGPCGKDCNGRFCENHSATRCVCCGDQATGECCETSGFVCGAPLCDNCTHGPIGHRRKAIVPEPVYTSTDTHQVEFGGNGGIYGSSAMVVPKDEPDHEPAFMVISPDDLAELNRKATAYNELKAVIDRLDCEIQDLKKLFV